MSILELNFEALYISENSSVLLKRTSN